MATTKFGLNQLKFNKGSKIYAKGDKADFAYYVHVGKVNIYSQEDCYSVKLVKERSSEKRSLSMNQDLSQLRLPLVVFFIQ